MFDNKIQNGSWRVIYQQDGKDDKRPGGEQGYRDGIWWLFQGKCRKF
jgi:hypothetical protein